MKLAYMFLDASLDNWYCQLCPQLFIFSSMAATAAFKISFAGSLFLYKIRTHLLVLECSNADFSKIRQ
jgi:hypothetical protein